MHVLGISKLGQHTQETVRDDVRFQDILAVEQDGTLILYQLMGNPKSPSWAQYYSEWARIAPISQERYQLSHMSIPGTWQELDVILTLGGCISAIADNKYHLFFG
jgi:hypothetical protein